MKEQQNLRRHIAPVEPGLFDRSERLRDLDDLGEPLARLDRCVAWELFRPVLEELPKPTPKGAGGRPSFDPLFMFKCLVIQGLYNLSDRQLQYQIIDRMSFKRFLGLMDGDRVPDEKTVWAFREALTQAGLMDRLFKRFGEVLEYHGLIVRHGQIVDASFVEVPKQRNTREENEQIKAGKPPKDWPDPKARQKDVDARWTKKNEVSYFGYKNHVKVDTGSKLIVDYRVTDASVHDSQALKELLSPEDPPTWCDSAYAGEPCQQVFESKGIEHHVIEKGNRGHPLTSQQKKRNRKKSKIRVRVEHVFGSMCMSMHAGWNRCIGKIRNRACIALTNLMYNILRFEQIQRLHINIYKNA